MLIHQSFKFELRPNGEQRRKMAMFAGACRFVYNKALALQIENRAKGIKHLSYFSMGKLLPEWKQEFPWLSETPAQALQQSLKNLEEAYKRFFAKRAGFPKFKKRGQWSSFRFPQGFSIRQGDECINLPKLGRVHYDAHRSILGTPKSITVSFYSGKWYASILTEREVEQPIHPSTSIIGIDLGIARFATLSDSSFIEPLSSLKKHEIRLRRYQRRMSSKVKFSQNWKKAKSKVRKVHSGIANARKDFLHKTSTLISKNHAVVIVEDLNVKSMSGSASGTVENPGKNVKQKSGLNKAILEQGWSEFRRMLGYKLEWAGGRLIAVPPHYTSQRCPECKHVSRENRKTQSEFKCMKCDYKNNADVVGAINIKAAGLAVIEREALVIACGEIGLEDNSMKQEPVKVTFANANAQ
jgi:putative transposase